MSKVKTTKSSAVSQGKRQSDTVVLPTAGASAPNNNIKHRKKDEKAKAEMERKRGGAVYTSIEAKIDYVFADHSLLELALTHKSFAQQNNERLEFIGDAVLGYLVGIQLYLLYPNCQEDRLSLMRSRLVSGKALAEVAGQLGVAPFVRLGSGEAKNGGRERASILADVLEAIIGAVHEDGGIEACLQVVGKLFSPRMQDLGTEELRDAKTALQEALQAQGIDVPVYAVARVAGADHKREYTVSCQVDDLQISAEGIASSRRGAEKLAAAEVLTQVLTQLQLTGAEPEPDKIENSKLKKAKESAKSKLKKKPQTDAYAKTKPASKRA